MGENTSNRILPLDALRGLAALSVLIVHYFVTLFDGATFPGYVHEHKIAVALGRTPLSILWAGHEAVLIFFLLSGFVLHLMLSRSRITYGAFTAKRIARLYVPYIVAVATAYCLAEALPRGGLAGLSDWINSPWTHLTWREAVGHTLFVTAFNTNAVDPPVWSLVHEMRISLVFPILAMAVRRYRPLRVLGTLALLNIAANATLLSMPSQALWPASYLQTIDYLLLFGIGATLAEHAHTVTGWYRCLTPLQKWGLLAIGIFSYTYGIRVASHLHLYLSTFTIRDWGVIPGATIILIAFLASPTLERWTDKGPLRFLGRVSYSLYLWHFIVLLSVLHAFYRSHELWLWLGLGVILSLIIAQVSYLYLERPAIQLGRSLSRTMGIRPMTRADA